LLRLVESIEIETWTNLLLWNWFGLIKSIEVKFDWLLIGFRFITCKIIKNGAKATFYWTVVSVCLFWIFLFFLFDFISSEDFLFEGQLTLFSSSFLLNHFKFFTKLFNVVGIVFLFHCPPIEVLRVFVFFPNLLKYFVFYLQIKHVCPCCDKNCILLPNRERIC